MYLCLTLGNSHFAFQLLTIFVGEVFFHSCSSASMCDLEVDFQFSSLSFLPFFCLSYIVFFPSYSLSFSFFLLLGVLLLSSWPSHLLLLCNSPPHFLGANSTSTLVGLPHSSSGSLSLQHLFCSVHRPEKRSILFCVSSCIFFPFFSSAMAAYSCCFSQGFFFPTRKLSRILSMPHPSHLLLMSTVFSGLPISVIISDFSFLPSSSKAWKFFPLHLPLTIFCLLDPFIPSY